MNRIVGIETEYGCLVNEEQAHGNPDSWPVRVKNHVFKKAKLGAIDLHYRDYEEPPGNGGFLLNGGRLYIDMGHLEYASPECLTVKDAVAYDIAGDCILQSALDAIRASEHVSFLKNNIDHHTGATFGCHENYLMRREVQFTVPVLGTLLSFLATRQLFTGSGRVGQANPLSFDWESGGEAGAPVDFQLSQRADHIVNDIYQWVQFNRAIINARDEPHADYRKYRRLHLLIGDSNMSPFANALKVGTTSLILTLLERAELPPGVILADAVVSTREISREGAGRASVRMEDGSSRTALEVQWVFFDHVAKQLGGEDAETDWILENWAFTLDALGSRPEVLVGGVDWISKKWLLEMFREKEGLTWQDPWLQSIDLEYHNINREKGLFHALTPSKRIGEFNDSVLKPEAVREPPRDTRAAGRGRAISRFQQGGQSYLINWDSIALDSNRYLMMSDPFETYEGEVDELVG
jgi:proteasome accessory factor A